MATRKSVQAEKRAVRATAAVRTAAPAASGADASARPAVLEQLALRLPVDLEASPVAGTSPQKPAGRAAGAKPRRRAATSFSPAASPAAHSSAGHGVEASNGHPPASEALPALAHGQEDGGEGMSSLVPGTTPSLPNAAYGVHHGLGDLRAALADGWEIVQPIFSRPLWSAPDDSATAFSFVLRGPHGTRLITVPQGRTVERFIRDRRLAVDYAR